MRLKGCGHVQVSVVAAVVSESVPERERDREKVGQGKRRG